MRVIRSGWQPFQVLLLMAMAVSGLGGLVVFDRLASPTVRDFPDPFGYLLLLVIGLASAVALAGAYMGEHARVDRLSLAGVWTEAGGVTAIATCGLVYGSWAWARNGTDGFAFSVILFFLALGASWRLARILRDVWGT